MNAKQRGSRPRRSAWSQAGLLVGSIGLLVAVAAPVLANSVPTDPEPDIACPADFGSGLLTKYTTDVGSADDPATWKVSVEFTLADDGSGVSCQLSLASYELASAAFVPPQTVFDSATGTFGAGTHVLTVALPHTGSLPGCFAQYDFVFGPVLDTITESQRYGDRQVRARIVGTEDCSSGGVQPTPTVTATPTITATATATPTQAVAPTPTQEVEGGTGTPAPEQSVKAGTGLPNTSTDGHDGGGNAPLLPLVLIVAALGGLSFVSVARSAVRAR